MRRFAWSLLCLTACTSAPPDGSSQAGRLGESPPTQKLAFVFGGASTPDSSTNDFGTWTTREVGTLIAQGYDTTVLFSSGLDNIPAQAASVAQLTELTGHPPLGFTVENFAVAMTNLVGRANQDDEVLIVVNTHGFACSDSPPPADPNVAGPEMFCVALGYPRPVDNWAEMHFDDIKPYLAQLDAKGAWTTILAATCDSGNALRVATSRTCVVSATGYETSRVTAFFSSWQDHTQAGQTVHDAYRAALPYTNDYERCGWSCPTSDDPAKFCAMPCSYYDTPWISAEQGYPAEPCDHFVL